MYWTLELASKLEDAPWPATKDELIDYAVRSGAPLEVLENLQEIEDEGEIYESIEDIWPDYPSKDDFFFNEEEYKPYLGVKTPQNVIVKCFTARLRNRAVAFKENFRLNIPHKNLTKFVIHLFKVIVYGKN